MIIDATLVITGLAIIFGLLLGYAALRFKVEGNPIVEELDSALPQTQCGQCTYPGCRPYAEAMSAGEADINQCPPGGESTIQQLADILGLEPKPLSAEHAENAAEELMVAKIIEADCIGCTLCIQACPVDAIVGASKQMHTVIESECTGCDLCLPPCPVDCIEMIPAHRGIEKWQWPEPLAIPVVVEHTQKKSEKSSSNV
jgi:electron transport complex protein RnfB